MMAAGGRVGVVGGSNRSLIATMIWNIYGATDHNRWTTTQGYRNTLARTTHGKGNGFRRRGKEG